MTMRVLVAVCTAPAQVMLLELEAAEGSTVARVLASLPEEVAPPRGEGTRVGIWGRLCRGEDVLVDGDRLEIYRPLPVDPKDARRRRSAVRRPGRRSRAG